MNPNEISNEAVINSMKACGMTQIAIEKVEVALDFLEYLKEDFEQWREEKGL